MDEDRDDWEKGGGRWGGYYVESLVKYLSSWFGTKIFDVRSARDTKYRES